MLWRRSDSSASSNGSAASRSAKRSPSSPSSSAPTVWFSETDACAAPSASSTCWSGRPVASASSSFVASRPELDLEPAGGAGELLLALDDVHGHANRPRVIRHGALHRLADPPGRVRRELEPAAPVELLDGAVEAERALLDEIEERHAEPAIALRDRDDEPEVRLDHHALGDGVAALDALRERDLLGSGEQLVAADVGEEQLEAVGGAGYGAGLVLLRGGLLLLGVGVRLGDLDVVRLELALEQLGVLLADVVLEHERLELGGLELASVLLGALHERLHVLRFEEFDELVLRQRPVSVLSNLALQCDKLTESTTVFGLFPGLTRLGQCHKLVTFAPHPSIPSLTLQRFTGERREPDRLTPPETLSPQAS